MRHDPLNDAIVSIKNHERKGKRQVSVTPSSRLLVEVLKVFQAEGFIDGFDVVDSPHGGDVTIHLTQRINDCGVIKPRYPVKADEYAQWEKQYLPARGFGVIVVTTPHGVMSHVKAEKENIGGRLIGYVY